MSKAEKKGTTDDTTQDVWCRVVKDKSTVAIIRLPIGVQSLKTLNKMWPGAMLTTSASLRDTLRDVENETANLADGND